ncbi:hypothetical protein D3C86_2013390 [compost metagenome]
MTVAVEIVRCLHDRIVGVVVLVHRLVREFDEIIEGCDLLDEELEAGMIRDQCWRELKYPSARILVWKIHVE